MEIPALNIVDFDIPFDRKKTYYLGGPMSGYAGYNYDAFEKACTVLRNDELNVVSPHEIDFGETEETRGTKPYQVYIDACLELLRTQALGLILLPGWPQSTGAMLELRAAIDLFLPVYLYLEPPEWENGSAVALVCMNRKPK